MATQTKPFLVYTHILAETWLSKRNSQLLYQQMIQHYPNIPIYLIDLKLESKRLSTFPKENFSISVNKITHIIRKIIWQISHFIIVSYSWIIFSLCRVFEFPAQIQIVNWHSKQKNSRQNSKLDWQDYRNRTSYRGSKVISS